MVPLLRIDLKPCRKCGSTDRFPAPRGRKLGRCRPCNAANERSRYQTHREKECARSRKAHAADPSKTQARVAHRRALKLKQRCTCCTNAQIAKEYALAQCLGLEVDHKKPLALGGMHCLKNLQSLSPSVEHQPKTRIDMRAIAVARRATNVAQ